MLLQSILSAILFIGSSSGYTLWGMANPYLMASTPASSKLMSGKFEPRRMLGDTEVMKAYLDFWGMEADADEMADAPLETMVSEDGKMITVMYAGDTTEFKFGEPTDMSTGKFH